MAFGISTLKISVVNTVPSAVLTGAPFKKIINPETGKHVSSCVQVNVTVLFVLVTELITGG